MKASGELLAGHLKAVGLLPLNRYGAGRLIAAVLAVSAPFVFALLAERHGPLGPIRAFGVHHRSHRPFRCVTALCSAWRARTDDAARE